MTNSTYNPSTGARIAADLFDFHKHIDGSEFKHKAADITTSPGVEGATNVQTSIDNINTFIASLADQGKAFASIPDGYDCYTNPSPNHYFDHTVPSLDLFLNPLFAAIIAGSTMPSGYDRLKHGGIIYIPAGTYYISATVNVPPSVIIFGEGYGTKIINATSLNISLSPPTVNVGATRTPVFFVKSDPNRSVNDSAVDSENLFMFSKSTKFINLTICDNFLEPTLLGDVYYKLPQNNIGNAPLIMQGQGSNLEILDVKLLGRALTSSESVSADGATKFAIKLDTAISNPDGTILKITNSFIDGFSLPISFATTGSCNDYLEIENSKIRSHGFLNNDGTSPSTNCIINMNDNNTKIVGNVFYGNHNNLVTLCYITTAILAPVVQNKSKILIASNITSVGRGDVLDIEMDPYHIDAGVISTILGSCFIQSFGNNPSGFTTQWSSDAASSQIFANKDNIVFGPATNLTAQGTNINISSPTNGGNITLDGAILSRTHTIAAQPYIIDATETDYIILVDLTTIAADTNITLPVPTNGRTIIIKDISGLGGTYQINVIPNGAEAIDGLNQALPFAVPYGCITLFSDGTNWFLI